MTRTKFRDIHEKEYRLTLHNELVPRTSWWKDEDRQEPANVWWLTGGGLSRLATDAEVQFWLAGEGSLPILDEKESEDPIKAARIYKQALEATYKTLDKERSERKLESGCEKLGRCLKPSGHEGSCNTSTAA